METVGAIMSADVATATPDGALDRAIALMAERVISCVVAVEGDRPVGVVSERDLVRKVLAPGRDPAALRVGEVMTAPVMTVTPDTTTLEALGALRAGGFRRLPVVDGRDALIGIVTQTDLIRALLTYLHRFTLHEILERTVQFVTRCVQQDTAVATLTRRYRTLDLRCAELLQLLYRTIRDLNAPLGDLRSFAGDLAEATRAIEVLLSAGEHDDPVLRDTVQRAETTLRRVTAENGAWVADVTERLQRANRVIERLIDDAAAAS